MVAFDVSSLVRRMGKGRVANVTLEGFFPSVHVHVPIQDALRVETLVALGALHWLQMVRSVVDHYVPLQHDL